MALPLVIARVPSPPSFASAAPQISIGKWTVTGTEVNQSESILLTGNLTIESGGNLTLEHDLLYVQSSYSGQNGITVEPGGSLYVYDSNITSYTKFKFNFDSSGSNLVMKGSSLSDIGYCPYFSTKGACAEFYPDGPQVATNGAVFENDTISSNEFGLHITGSYEKVVGDRFLSNVLVSIWEQGGGFDTYSNNTFQQNPAVTDRDGIIWMQGSQNTSVENNVLMENLSMLSLSSSYGGMDGVKLFGFANDDRVLNNTIEVQNIGVFISSCNETSIEDNTIRGGESGISDGTIVNTVIAGNTISSPPILNVMGGAINLGSVFESVVANNTILGNLNSNQGSAVSVDLSNNCNFFNNHISVSNATFLFELFSVSNDTLIGNTLADYPGPSGSSTPISELEYGLVLSENSSKNKITDNNVSAQHSVTIQESSSNTIYANDFIDYPGGDGSLGGPYDNGANNWFSGTVGNYWNYNGSTIVRNVISPDGKEPYSAKSQFKISPVKVTYPPPIPYGTNSSYTYPNSLIENEDVIIDNGNLQPDTTIINSTVELGIQGPVSCCSGNVTIINSKLVNAGYGFSLSVSSMSIDNSTIYGVSMDEGPGANNVTILNSVLSSNLAAASIYVEGLNSLVLENDTFLGQQYAIFSDLIAQNLTVSNNRIYNSIAGVFYIPTTPENTIIDNNTIVGALGGGGGGGFSLGSNVQFEDNHISQITNQADIFFDGNDSTIAGNTIADSYDSYGVITFSGNNNSIYQNSIINCTDGPAILVSGNFSTVFGNNFTNANTINVGGFFNVIYHNNFINYTLPPVGSSSGDDSFSLNGEGNYWSAYTGKDPNFTGIGDTPYTFKHGQDNYPYMKPNGWLTKFYLITSTNLPAIISFQINGTTFSTDSSGSGTYRLGYVANYNISFPETVTLSNGTQFQFAKWSNGDTSPTQTFALSANTTISVTYAKSAESLSAKLSSSSGTTATGKSAKLTATIAGPPQKVSISVSGQPKGVSFSFAKNPIKDSQGGVKDAITIKVGSTVVHGTYNLTFTFKGADGKIVTLTYKLTVT